MERTFSFDERCLELAEHFLPGASEVEKRDLAQDIQDAVERRLGSTEQVGG